MERSMLREGDRVRLRRAVLWASVGAKGTIVRTYGVAATICSVRFDGQTQEWAVQLADLERIESQERQV